MVADSRMTLLGFRGPAYASDFRWRHPSRSCCWCTFCWRSYCSCSSRSLTVPTSMLIFCYYLVGSLLRCRGYLWYEPGVLPKFVWDLYDGILLYGWAFSIQVRRNPIQHYCCHKRRLFLLVRNVSAISSLYVSRSLYTRTRQSKRSSPLRGAIACSGEKLFGNTDIDL